MVETYQKLKLKCLVVKILIQMTSRKQWRVTMQQDKLGEYYNLDFEKKYKHQ